MKKRIWWVQQGIQRQGTISRIEGPRGEKGISDSGEVGADRTHSNVRDRGEGRGDIQPSVTVGSDVFPEGGVERSEFDEEVHQREEEEKERRRKEKLEEECRLALEDEEKGGKRKEEEHPLSDRPPESQAEQVVVEKDAKGDNEKRGQRNRTVGDAKKGQQG